MCTRFNSYWLYVLWGLEQAQRASELGFLHNEVPVGSCLVTCKTSFLRYNNQHQHSEMLFDYNHYNNSDIFITHEPCIMCSTFLLNSGISNIFFLFASPNGGCGGKINIFTLYESQIGLYGPLASHYPNYLSKFFLTKR